MHCFPALVFDDPVSSLDHRWRGQVANVSWKKRRNRRVIVFTHDLVFVNDLNDHATKTGGQCGHDAQSWRRGSRYGG